MLQGLLNRSQADPNIWCNNWQGQEDHKSGVTMFIQCGEPFSLSWIKFVTNYKYNRGHKNNNNYTIRWHHQMAPKGLYLSSSSYSTFTPHKYRKKGNKITNYRKLSGCKDRPNNRHCHYPKTTTNGYDLRKLSSALFLCSDATKCDQGGTSLLLWTVSMALDPASFFVLIINFSYSTTRHVPRYRDPQSNVIFPNSSDDECRNSCNNHSSIWMGKSSSTGSKLRSYIQSQPPKRRPHKR